MSSTKQSLTNTSVTNMNSVLLIALSFGKQFCIKTLPKVKDLPLFQPINCKAPQFKYSKPFSRPSFVHPSQVDMQTSFSELSLQEDSFLQQFDNSCGILDPGHLQWNLEPPSSLTISLANNSATVCRVNGFWRDKMSIAQVPVDNHQTPNV